MNFKVSEIFYSIQGEGKFLGIPSYFIRLSGCNLRCVWCDTPYASWKPTGDLRSVEDVLAKMAEYPKADHVVITGGEPFIFNDLPGLIRVFKEKGMAVTVETAGTVYLENDADLISIAPKLSNSTPKGDKWEQKHDELRINIEAISAFLKSSSESQLKFVMDKPEDLQEIQELLKHFPSLTMEDVFLMPQARSRDEFLEKSLMLVDLALKYNLRYTPRLQTMFWGDKRGV